MLEKIPYRSLLIMQVFLIINTFDLLFFKQVLYPTVLNILSNKFYLREKYFFYYFDLFFPALSALSSVSCLNCSLISFTLRLPMIGAQERKKRAISHLFNIICGVIYWQHNSAERFLDQFEEAIDCYSATGKPTCLLGDVNINILCAQTCNNAQQFLDCQQSYVLLPTIDKPTRVYNNSATLREHSFFRRGGRPEEFRGGSSTFCLAKKGGSA